jgi:hypothetical protein
MSTEILSKYLEKKPEKTIFIARELYLQKFSEMTETAFIKALERLNHMGMLMRLSKGVYCKPRQTRFGAVPAGEHEIASYFMGEDNRYGFIVGYRLYNKYGLTTQVGKQLEIYSRKSHVAQGSIKNIHLRKLGSFYRPEMLPMIEFLEILENYQKIEDLNQRRFLIYCSMAVKKFNEKIFERIYQQMGYKKRTIAFLKKILDTYGVGNTLKKYLNGTSKYQLPQWESNYGTL